MTKRIHGSDLLRQYMPQEICKALIDGRLTAYNLAGDIYKDVSVNVEAIRIENEECYTNRIDKYPLTAFFDKNEHAINRKMRSAMGLNASLTYDEQFENMWFSTDEVEKVFHDHAKGEPAPPDYKTVPSDIEDQYKERAQSIKTGGQKLLAALYFAQGMKIEDMATALNVGKDSSNMRARVRGGLQLARDEKLPCLNKHLSANGRGKYTTPE